MGNRRYIDRESSDVPLENFFKAWREHAGMTQAQVEAKFGWPASRVSNLENGRAVVTQHILTTLGRLYGCSAADLLGRAPPPKGVAAQLLGAGLVELPGSIAALGDTLATQQRLVREIAEIRAELLPRLAAVERELTELTDKTATAIKNAAMLAELVKRCLRHLEGGDNPPGEGSRDAPDDSGPGPAAD